MDKVANIFAAIVTLAMIATIVGSRNTANQITALGSAFSNSIKAATHPGV